MSKFEIRTSLPTSTDKVIKYYNNYNRNGYSKCINGKPTHKVCNVVANCVGLACSRFNELINEILGIGFKYTGLNCNAENFVERAISLGLSVVDHPVLGGIMVWQKGATLKSDDGAGHVAVVERVDSDNQIYTSESSYGSRAFFNATRTNKNGRWGLSAGYKFRGCIVNPAISNIGYKENKETSTSTSSNISSTSSEVTYTVKKGDNLTKIAKKYNTTWQKLYNKNKSTIDNDAKSHGVKKNYYNFIYAGQVLKI